MNEYLEDRIYNYSWSENHGFTVRAGFSLAIKVFHAKAVEWRQYTVCSIQYAYYTQQSLKILTKLSKILFQISLDYTAVSFRYGPNTVVCFWIVGCKWFIHVILSCAHCFHSDFYPLIWEHACILRCNGILSLYTCLLFLFLSETENNTATAAKKNLL